RATGCAGVECRATAMPTSTSAAPPILRRFTPSPSTIHEASPPMTGTRYMNTEARTTPMRPMVQFQSVHATYTGTITVHANAAQPPTVITFQCCLDTHGSTERTTGTVPMVRVYA